MIIITSLAPSHKNYENQQKAVDSWKALGCRVISVNHASEIEQLKEYNVEFVEPEKTGILHFGKHYVPISEIVKVIKREGSGLIVNSDIIIKELPELHKDPVIFSRWDFTNDFSDAQLFPSGFDGFYLTSDHCDLPESKLCLGQCHWDYWLPIQLLYKGYKVGRHTGRFLYHKKHALQYDNKSWRKTARLFMDELGMRGSEDRGSNTAYQYIRSKIHDINIYQDIL